MAHREKTKYTGVYYRTSSTKRYDGKPDVCFDIAYKLEGKLIWEGEADMGKGGLA